MRRRWVIEAEYPDKTRPAAVDGQLQGLLDLFTCGRAHIVEAITLGAPDAAEGADAVAEDVKPVLRLVASS